MGEAVMQVADDRITSSIGQRNSIARIAMAHEMLYKAVYQ